MSLPEEVLAFAKDRNLNDFTSRDVFNLTVCNAEQARLILNTLYKKGELVRRGPGGKTGFWYRHKDFYEPDKGFVFFEFDKNTIPKDGVDRSKQFTERVVEEGDIRSQAERIADAIAPAIFPSEAAASEAAHVIKDISEKVKEVVQEVKSPLTGRKIRIVIKEMEIVIK